MPCHNWKRKQSDHSLNQEGKAVVNAGLGIRPSVEVLQLIPIDHAYG
jgi:uncharacterized protein with von Willebrand factor type A (vWA) domain